MCKFAISMFRLTSHTPQRKCMMQMSIPNGPNVHTLTPSIAFEKIVRHIHNNFKNSKLKKVVNVFQMTYVNDKSQGIGDFFRGSVYLTCLCKLLNVGFDVHLLNHPLHICLSNQENEYESMKCNEIYAHIDKADRRGEFIIDFINILNACDEEIAYVYFNYDPRFDIEHPKHGVIYDARNVIIPKIQPTERILNFMDKKLEEINVERKQYRIIHIRLGDHFMIKREASHLNPIFRIHIQYLMNDLKNKLNRNEKYIIVGDNNIAKSIIARRFNNVHMFNNKIIHLGEKTQFETMNEMSLMDTIIDFCIIRYSRSVVSYSAYGHGSGFSKQCAHIYGVPFEQLILHPRL